MRLSANSSDPAINVQKRSISVAAHQAWSCGQNRFGDSAMNVSANAQPNSKNATPRDNPYRYLDEKGNRANGIKLLLR